MPGKRKRTIKYTTKRLIRKYIQRARKQGTRVSLYRNVSNRLRRLESTVETKEYTWRTSPNVSLPHNQITVLQQQAGGDLNAFRSANSTDDPMGVGGSRIGDKVALRGLMIRGMFENALGRPKVYYRVMFVKCAKGDTPTRATLFKDNTGNKMIDQINTERFTVISQRIFNINASNAAAQNVNATGSPYNPENQSGAGVGTRMFNMWIPGNRIVRGGHLVYENASQTQTKFFDYRICVLVYDWYGTPQDVNNVGKINELYTKVYLKDA